MKEKEVDLEDLEKKAKDWAKVGSCLLCFGLFRMHLEDQ